MNRYRCQPMQNVVSVGHSYIVVASASTLTPGYALIVTNPELNHTVIVRKPIFVTGSSYDVNLLSQVRKHHRQIIRPTWMHFSGRTLA